MLTGESPGGHYWWCHPHVALRPHLRRPAMIETMPETTTAQIQTPLVHQPRQAAEELTGCRVQVPDSDTGSDHVRVHLPLPEAVAPSLSHVAVAIDAAAGQAAARHLSSRSTAIRTLSLNAQLTAPLTAGGWLRVVGRPRALQGRSILASTEVFDSAGDLVALGTCRFVVVDQARSGSPGAAPEALSPLAIPESWDAALGLGAAVSEGIPSSGEPMTVRPAAPEATTNNGASMVHGGCTGPSPGAGHAQCIGGCGRRPADGASRHGGGVSPSSAAGCRRRGPGAEQGAASGPDSLSGCGVVGRAGRAAVHHR